MLVTICLVSGWWQADRDRAAALSTATAAFPARDGHLRYSVPQLPEAFIEYVAARVPAHDPVEYVPKDLALCRRGVQRRTWWPRLLWIQYKLAPRRMACGDAARWRVYLGDVPAGVPAADRWSDDFAVVPVRS
jgi:hypothetical protein